MIEEVGVSLSVLRPYAALYTRLVWMAVTPGGSLFWRRYIKKTAYNLLKTCQQSTWITGTMSYGLMRSKLICLVPMASSMCGSNQMRSTKISVSCLQTSMVMRMSWSGATWVLQGLESYISLRETWTPTCTVKYCSRAWSPPSRTWVKEQCFKFISSLLEKGSRISNEGYSPSIYSFEEVSVSRVLFRVVFKFSWDILFESCLSFPLVWWCQPPRYPSICMFHFLRVF